MPNRGRVTQHTIHPHIASKPANTPPRHGVKEQPEISPHAPNTSHGLLRPYPTSLSMYNAAQRQGHTTHHTATHSIQTRRRTTETRSQRTARNLSTPRKTPGILFCDPTQLLQNRPHGPGSAATLPLWFFIAPATQLSCPTC